MSAILVIEDSMYIRKLIREILTPEGYDVMEAEDGLDALRLVGKNKYDGIILDLIMPEIDGLTVLKRLHESGSIIPVIIVTAHLQDSVRELCLQLGAAGFINKPFNRDELRYTVKKIIGKNP